ncbi:hypothetical protein CSKR_100455 [Clonorchis sinensis]|uniref:Uncharacterized protein n=1 Tax=Clonorchis sinensis TaxID=79923 RepID=A0A419Q968_CLOSI|nr:hypothetical protein CSKR_100455 [Clonorchis sinensis]
MQMSVFLENSPIWIQVEHKQLEHEAAWCSTFSCLETSQTRDSAGFQVSLSQNQICLQMCVFIDHKTSFFSRSKWGHFGERLVLYTVYTVNTPTYQYQAYINISKQTDIVLFTEELVYATGRSLYPIGFGSADFINWGNFAHGFDLLCTLERCTLSEETHREIRLESSRFFVFYSNTSLVRRQQQPYTGSPTRMTRQQFIFLFPGWCSSLSSKPAVKRILHLQGPIPAAYENERCNEQFDGIGSIFLVLETIELTGLNH